MTRHHRKTLAPLLILALALRTLVAPGYMLSTSLADGFKIVFCYGATGLYGHDGQHHHDGSQQDKDTGGGHHATPTCGFWSTSSHGFIADEIASLPFVSPSNNEPEHRLVFVYQPPTLARGIRAPPVIS